MKFMKFILLAVLATVSTTLFAQQTAQKTDTLKVYGECGMCQNRIQKALKLEGVSAATWDSDTKLLVVSYDPAKITNDDIQKKVASVGHDTEKYTASEDIYNKLPGCCHYERKKTGTGQK